MMDVKGNYKYIALFLFLGLFMFRFFYGREYGGSHMLMGTGHGIGASTQNYVYVAMVFITMLMFFLRFFPRRK